MQSHAPLRKTRKRELKFQSKCWMTCGLQKSIMIKNELFVKFTNFANSIIKEGLHNDHKSNRNMVLTLLRQSKKKKKNKLYNKCFKDNTNNMKNTWRAIKSKKISIQKTTNK